jgi:hypothetical protein
VITILSADAARAAGRVTFGVLLLAAAVTVFVGWRRRGARGERAAAWLAGFVVLSMLVLGILASVKQATAASHLRLREGLLVRTSQAACREPRLPGGRRIVPFGAPYPPMIDPSRGLSTPTRHGAHTRSISVQSAQDEAHPSIAYGRTIVCSRSPRLNRRPRTRLPRRHADCSVGFAGAVSPCDAKTPTMPKTPKHLMLVAGSVQVPLPLGGSGAPGVLVVARERRARAPFEDRRDREPW